LGLIEVLSGSLFTARSGTAPALLHSLDTCLVARITRLAGPGDASQVRRKRSLLLTGKMTLAGIILPTAMVLIVVGIHALAFAAPPTVSHVINYALAVDPDATDRLQISLPAASEYVEDVQTTHGTRSPSVFLFQDLTLLPNDNTAWHFHPGIVLITVAEGSVDWYDAKCIKHVHSAGDFFMESDQLHYVRNSGPAQTRMIITYVIEKGVTSKIYAPAPPCAAALGLN
jgi:hypothetical protein